MAGCDLSPAMSATSLGEAELAWLVAADVRELPAEPSATRTLVLRLQTTAAAHDRDLRAVPEDVTRMRDLYKMQSSPLAVPVRARPRLPPAAEHAARHAAAP